MSGFTARAKPGCRVLVAFASRHGSTEEIALELGRCLAEGDCRPTVRAADLAVRIESFDAVIVGSAIYMGRWLAEAREFLATHRSNLRTRPTWLFASGPVGDPPRPEADASDGPAFANEIGAVEYRRFNGRLDHSRLSFPEKAAVALVGAPEGDYRDWTAIRTWGAGIAADISMRNPASLRFGT